MTANYIVLSGNGQQALRVQQLNFGFLTTVSATNNECYDCIFNTTSEINMTFDDLIHDFSDFGILVSPSEVHGMFCGRLVMGEILPTEQLLQITTEFIDADAFSELDSLILDLYQFSASQITHTGLEFQLLLPNDDSTLGMRTQELAQWCQGFLYGLGQAGLSGDTKLSEDAVETLADLVSISQLRSEDADEEDEMNFFELAEFVRVIVLLLYTELGPPDTDEKPILH